MKKITEHTSIYFFTLLSLFLVSLGVSSVRADTSMTDQQIISALCDGRDHAAHSDEVCQDIISSALETCRRNFDPANIALVPGEDIDTTLERAQNNLDSCRQNVINRRDTLISQRADSESTGNFSGDCSESLHPDQCGITAVIRLIADALSVVVGVIIVAMIVVGGIQYSSAGSNPQAVSAAKKKISQALLALLIYFFLFAFLQWLVPGGVF